MVRQTITIHRQWVSIMEFEVIVFELIIELRVNLSTGVENGFIGVSERVNTLSESGSRLGGSIFFIV